MPNRPQKPQGTFNKAAQDRVDEQNALREKEERSDELAFAAVFGAEGERSPAQTRVVDRLKRVCRTSQTTIGVDRNGIIDPSHTIMNEGARQVWLMIDSLVTSGSTKKTEGETNE